MTKLIKNALVFLREDSKITDEELKKKLLELEEHEDDEEKITGEFLKSVREKLEKAEKLDALIEKITEKSAEKVFDKLSDIEPTSRKSKNFDGLETKTVTLVDCPTNPAKSVKMEVTKSSLENMGEYFRAYARAAREGDKNILTDTKEKIYKKMRKDKGDSEIMRKTQNEGDGASGGFLVEREFERSIWKVMETYGVARQIFRVLPMNAEEKDLTGLIGKPVFTGVGEGVAPSTGTKITFSQPVLKAARQIAFIIASSELIEDNSTNEEIWSLVVNLYAEALAKREDYLDFMGNTTKIVGLMVSTNPQITDAFLGGSPTSGKTSFADLTGTDLKNLQHAVSTANRKKGVYVMHPDILNIIDLMQNEVGDYLFFKPGDANRPPTLWGKQVIESDVMPDASMDAPSVKFIAFVNGETAGAIGNRRSLTLKMFDSGTVPDSTGADVNLATTEQEAMKGSARLAFTVCLGESIARLSTSDS